MIIQLQRKVASYHEAGHAVVALSLGIGVVSISIDAKGGGLTEVSGARHFFPRDVWVDATSETHQRMLLRQSLVVHVAGDLATYLSDCRKQFGEWQSLKRLLGEEKEGLPMSSERLVSNKLTAANEDHDPGSDAYRAWLFASAIWLRTPEGRGVLGQWIEEDPQDKAYVREVRRAEQRAAIILRQHWQAVEAIADRLLRYKSGRMTHSRLMKLVGGRFAPAQAG